MVKTIRIYLAHPIMGATGTDDEVKQNIRLGKAYGAFIRAYLGPGYDIYVPADHDEMPQIAYKDGTFKIDDILSADLAIVDRCKVLVAGLWAPSKGVEGEIKHAWTKMPIYKFSDIDRLIQICGRIEDIYG